MFRESDTLTGLCVGTTKIAVIVADRDPRMREAAQIIGIGAAPSQGIRKGLIVNLEQAVRSVRNAVKDAENMVGFQLTEAMVSFNADVSSMMTRGMVSLGRTPCPVTVDDIERVIEAAQSELSIPANRIPLHTVPVRYAIDANSGIDDPLGMTGMRLEMDLQTITVPMPHVYNVMNCVQRAGIKVEGLVVKPIASALGALTDEEMRVGVISLCIGGGTTGLAFYRDGRPVRVGIVPIGGDHITNDLASVLRLPLNRAEDLKKRLFEEGGDDFSVAGTGKHSDKGAERTVDPNVALDVIGCRLEELFTEHVSVLIPDRDPNLFPAGIVLSGGVAKTPGIDALLTDIFKMPVRVADPLDYYHMPPGRNDTSYINATGVIRYILSQERNPYQFIDVPTSQLQSGMSLPTPSAVRKEVREVPRNRRGVRDIMDKLMETLKELF